MLRRCQSDYLLFHYYRAKRDLALARRGRITIVLVLRRHGQSGGWEVASAWLRRRGRDYQIALSETHLMVLYCATRSRVPLTASQIASRIERYAHEVSRAALRTTRTAVRKQFERIRAAIRACANLAGLSLDPADVIQSTTTSTNEVRYRINANTIFMTVDSWHPS